MTRRARGSKDTKPGGMSVVDAGVKLPPPRPGGSPGGRTLMARTEREFRKKYAPELTKPGPMAARLLENYRDALDDDEVGFLESMVDYDQACQEVGRAFWGSKKQNAWLLAIHGRMEGICPTCGHRVEVKP